MHGTFYINSGIVGAELLLHDLAEVDALAADGNEIGGHTVDHQRLADLTPDQQRHEICDDAATLRGHGYTITSFAYPLRRGQHAARRPQALLRTAATTSARKVGDLREPGLHGLRAVRSRRRIPPAESLRRSGRTSTSRGPLTLAELQA